MKKVFLYILSFLIAFSAIPAFCEEPSGNESALLSEKHEEMIQSAIQLIARYGMDDVSVYSTDKVFERGTDAWKVLTQFDKGWFTKTKEATSDENRDDTADKAKKWCEQRAKETDQAKKESGGYTPTKYTGSGTKKPAAKGSTDAK